MTVLVYPLEQVLEIKRRRVEEQEKVVNAKKEALRIEEEKLVECERERDKVKQHHQDKLDQLRNELDQGTTSDKVLQMKNYIKIVIERVKVEEKKVEDQQEQVQLAVKNLEVAKEELRIKRQEVEKLETHKEDWMKIAKKELQEQEQRELDEIGSQIYTRRMREGY